MDPRSQKAAMFAAEFIYGMSQDFAVRQAVRHMQSLEEVLAHAQLEKDWKAICAGEEEKPDDGVIGESFEGKHSTLLCAVLESENVQSLQQPEHAAKREVAEMAAASAKRQVSSQLTCIDASMSLDRLSSHLRSTDVCSKIRGTVESSVMIWYSVESAGEHERDPRRSPSPLGRDQMEKVLRAVLSTRGEVPDWDAANIVYPQLDPSDLQHGMKLSFVDFQIYGFITSSTCACNDVGLA